MTTEKETSHSLGFAQADTSRAARCGRPEVIFCQGKTPGQVAEIAAVLAEKNGFCLCTRAERMHFDAVLRVFPGASYHSEARVIRIGSAPRQPGELRVGVITAGTSDLPVAWEAAETLCCYGWEVSHFSDVGVAGLHRLLSRIEEIRACHVLIVIAGMDGALPAVVGGLVAHPIIAVPTSIGYGANFGGVAPLLSMLNSCSSGVTVTNIDNGFGAACAADAILRLLSPLPNL